MTTTKLILFTSGLIGYLIILYFLVSLTAKYTRRALMKLNSNPNDQKRHSYRLSKFYFVKGAIDTGVLFGGLYFPLFFLTDFSFIDKLIYLGIALIFPIGTLSQLPFNKESHIVWDGTKLYLKWSFFGNSIDRKIDVSEISSIKKSKQEYVINVINGTPIIVPINLLHGFKGYSSLLSVFDSQSST